MKSPKRSADARPATPPLPGDDSPVAERKIERYAVDWVHRENAADELVGELERRATRRHRRRAAMVAGAAALLLVIGFVWHPAPRQVQPAPAAASATVSLPLRQVLPDGSVVELKDDAQVVVDFTSSLRRVLLQRGEAHFQVAKDRQEPFVVQIGQVEVRAVGTAFSVHLNQTSAEVMVTEGRVAVQRPDDYTAAATASKLQPLAVVEMGKRVVVDIASASAGPAEIEPVTANEMARRLAWRIPRLEFSGTPLAEAIALFNRHNEVQLVLAGSGLADLKVSGFLRADKTETFVRLLESDFGLTAKRRGSHEIVLSRAR